MPVGCDRGGGTGAWLSTSNRLQRHTQASSCSHSLCWANHVTYHQPIYTFTPIRNLGFWHMTFLHSANSTLNAVCLLHYCKSLPTPHIIDSSILQLESLTPHQTLSTVCLCLYSDGYNICYSTVSLNRGLSTPKFNAFISVPQYIKYQFGENPTNTVRDIMLTSPESAVSSIFYSTVTLTFDLWLQIMKRSSLYHK